MRAAVRPERRTSNVTPAIAIAKSLLSICMELAMIVGSYSTVAAAMAVKCNVQTAAVNRLAASNFEVRTLKHHIAVALRMIPAAIEAMTKTSFQRICPETLMACMPA